MSTDQTTRFIEIKTGLSGNNIRLRSFSGQEQMSRLFTYNLDIVCVGDELSRDDQVTKLVGQDVTIRMDLKEGERFFHGIISRIRSDYSEDGGTIYRAEMVPKLWLLTRKSNCRIFQEETPDAIIQTILDEHGIETDCSGLTATYPTREYVVQYRETDFNFVSRLMEQYGISYYFKHVDGCHTMHLIDSIDGYHTNEESSVSYFLSRHESMRYQDHLTDWERQYQFVSGKFAQTDYNFKEPSTNLLTDKQTTVDQPQAKDYEVYDYPGEYVEKSQGTTEIGFRMEEEEATYIQIGSASTCRTFNVGGKFTIESHPCQAEEGQEYVITSIQHTAVDPTMSGGSGAEYSNTFSCMPAATIFRPARVTPKPLVSGIQTAVVVGPDGEEIYTDEWGRIKVHFHWDRDGQCDGTDSIWIRVANQVAGKKWGFFSLPRIGQEVVIDFLEGDPDRPVCMGGVYNNEQMPHYTLPDDMTKSYIKTNSTKGGEGFNEICFEDLADNERFFMHAQKDMDTRVLNVSKERILLHRHQIIGNEDDNDGNQSELVWGNKQQTVKKSHQALIEGSQKVKIGTGAEDPGVSDLWIEDKSRVFVGAGGKHQVIDGDYLNSVGGEYGVDVTGNAIVKSGQSVSIEGGMDIKQKAMNHHVEADMALHAKGGMTVGIEGGMEVHIKGGMSLVLEGGMSVCLKCGGNFINVTTAGIFIQGTLVGINSGGAAGSGSGCSPQSPDSPGSPEDAEEAAPEEPEEAHDESTGHASNE